MKQPKVAKVIDDFTVVLNIGSKNGVSPNQDYVLYRIGDEVKDPDTGESLGILENVIGRGVITHVQENLSTLQSSKLTITGKKLLKNNSLYEALLSGSDEFFDATKSPRPFEGAKVGDLAKKI